MSEEAEELINTLLDGAQIYFATDRRQRNLMDEARGALLAYIERIERERDEARVILAHTDIGSLPNDWSLTRVAEARIDDMIKLRDQVRDTCARAEQAEARIAALEAENARTRQNSERYEWLRGQAEDYDGYACFPDVPYRNGLHDGFEAKTVDAAIDAVRKPTPTLICPECGADRYRELCPRMVGDCPMVGHPQIIERAGRAARKP